jgi:hypothetical protein
VFVSDGKKYIRQNTCISENLLQMIVWQIAQEKETKNSNIDIIKAQKMTQKIERSQQIFYN